jgi:hypothetical protein
MRTVTVRLAGRRAGAGFLARRSGHLLGRLAAQFAVDQPTVETERGGDFGRVAGDEAAPRRLFRVGQMTEGASIGPEE